MSPKKKAPAAEENKALSLIARAAGALSTGYELVENLAVGATVSLGDSETTATITIPKEWNKRTKQAWAYYKEVDAVNQSIKTWAAFIIGNGIQFRCASEDDREKVLDFARKQELDDFLQRAITSLLGRGEIISFKDIKSEELGQLRLLNPLSMQPTFENGVLTELKQFDEKAMGSFYGKALETYSGDQLKDFCYIRNDVLDWENRGESIIIPAFDKIPILQNLRRAERAIATRWIFPLRMIRIGGLFGKYLFKPTSAHLEEAKKAFNDMSMQQGIIAPYYWDVKTYGTDGVVLETSPRIAIQVAHIAFSMGLYPFLITGEGSSYANVKVILKASRNKIRLMTIKIRKLLDWIFDEEMKAHIGIGGDAKLDYTFTGLNIDREEWEAREDRELFKTGVMSRATLQERSGLDPAHEDFLIDSEPVRVARYLTPMDLAQLVNVNGLPPEIIQELYGLEAGEIKKLSSEAGLIDIQKVYQLVNEKMKAKANLLPAAIEIEDPAEEE